MMSGIKNDLSHNEIYLEFKTSTRWIANISDSEFSTQPSIVLNRFACLSEHNQLPME